MSSASPESQGTRTLQVTLLASEWGSSKVRHSTINRELAILLAKCPEADITFFVPRCSGQEKKEALNHKINITAARQPPGYEELERLSYPPKHLEIDVIVGHGVKLGYQAQVIRNSRKCKWFQVVHKAPEELGMFKSYANPISKGEEKHKIEVEIEVELCEMADFVVGVGPKLSETFRSYLRRFKKDQTSLDLTPGIFDEFVSVKQVPDERKRFRFLVFGRGHVEDFALKGFDAGKAVASLPETLLVFVGAPEGKHEEVAERLLKCRIPADRLNVRGYVNRRESLKRLLCEVGLALMPSGFELTALEALSAGVPVLVSKGQFGSSFVFDSEDPEIWAAAIKKIWDKDRLSGLEEAELLRTSYESKYSWAKQCNALVDKMINLVSGM